MKANQPTTREDVQAAIREFIHGQFPAARRRGISDHDSLLEQGVIDSMGVLEIVTFIEREFSITLTDEELVSDHFDSVASLAELVSNKTSEVGQWTS